MLCSQCLAYIPDRLRFCPHCGSLLSYQFSQLALSWHQLYNLGCRAYQDGSTGEAEQYFLKTLQLNPSHQLSWYNLGTIYLKNRYLHKAVKCLIVAKLLNPLHPESRINLAAAYCKLHEPDAAVNELRDLATFNRNDKRAKHLLRKLKHALEKKGETVDL